MRKLFLVLAMAALAAGSARAFQTWPCEFCPGTLNSTTIHDFITEILMRERQFSPLAYDMLINEMEQADEPFSEAVHNPFNHFDDNLIADSRAELLKRLDRAVGKEVAGQILSTSGKMNEFFAIFGQIVHAAHDFYAHTTYLELQLKKFDAGQGEGSGPDDFPLMDLARKDSPTPAGVKSGYYGDEMFSMVPDVLAEINAKYPGARLKKFDDYCQFLDCGSVLPRRPSLRPPPPLAYSSFMKPEAYFSYEKAMENVLAGTDELHLYINKDSNDSPMGRVAHPTLGKTLHEMAARMAARETVLVWDRMEKAVRTNFPEDADCIVRSIKKGWVVPECVAAPPNLSPEALGIAGHSGRLKMAFRSDFDANLEVQAPDAEFFRYAGAKKAQGNVDLVVDWSTGEIVGQGWGRTGGPLRGELNVVSAGGEIEYAKLYSDDPNGVHLYATGWLEDGGQKIRVLRVYTVERDRLRVESPYFGSQAGLPPDEQPERLVDSGFGDVAMDGTPAQIGPVKHKIFHTEVAWIETAEVRLTSLRPPALPPDYKKTRNKHGDPGPLARKAGIPLAESYESLKKEFREALPEIKEELAQMESEMSAESMEGMDPGEAAQYRQMMAQARGKLEEADQKMREDEKE